MNEKVVVNTEFRKFFRNLYFLVLIVPFFWQLPLLLGLTVATPMQLVFRPFLLCIGAIAVTGLWLTKQERPQRLTLDAGILLLAFGWMIIVFLLHRYVLEEATPILQRAAIAWLVIYPAGYVLEDEESKKGVMAIAACWVAVMTLLAVIGIACTVTGTALEDLSGNVTFRYEGRRLRLGTWITPTAENILTAWMLAAMGLILSWKKWKGWLYAIAMAILLLAISLTDGRSGILSIGIFAGGFAFILLLKQFQKKRVLDFFIGAAAAIACILVVYFGTIQLQKGFPSSHSQVKSMREVLIQPFLSERTAEEESAVTDAPVSAEEANSVPVEEAIPAPAEEAIVEEQTTVVMEAVPTVEEQTATVPDAEPAVVPKKTVQFIEPTNSHRKIEFTLNGRTEIWGSALRIMQSNADNILLIGRPGSLSVETFQKYDPLFLEKDHLHNIYLQVTAEYGIPGTILLLAFVVVFVVYGLKLVFALELPIWKRMLPVPAVVLLIADLADVFLRFGQENMAPYVLFLFMGLTISQARRIR